MVENEFMDAEKGLGYLRFIVVNSILNKIIHYFQISALIVIKTINEFFKYSTCFRKNRREN